MENFSPDQKAWLSEHKALREAVDECLEDAENVNPLENGQPDMEPYNQALKAVHLTIEVHRNNLIGGPYDTCHWELISRYLSITGTTLDQECKFWSLFSFHCAMFKNEDDSYANEIIYLKSMVDLGNMVEHLEDFETGSEVADFGTNTIKNIKGEGVHARMI